MGEKRVRNGEKIYSKISFPALSVYWITWYIIIIFKEAT